MRDLLVVVDSRFRNSEWRIWETKFVHVDDDVDDAEAVEALCVKMATANRLAWNGQLRVRSWAGIGWPEALTTDLEFIPPTAEYIYDKIVEGV